jgi:hypothetical protein
MFRAKCEANEELANAGAGTRRWDGVALRSYNRDRSMQGLAAANAAEECCGSDVWRACTGAPKRILDLSPRLRCSRGEIISAGKYVPVSELIATTEGNRR